MMQLLKGSVENQTAAVAAFQVFEREEREFHGTLARSLDAQTQSVARVAELQERILNEQVRTREIVDRVSRRSAN
ncbi:MAG: hypothetical protein RL885_33210 [Planctomycetota bacterium]